MSQQPQNLDQYLANGCGRCALGGTPECKVQPWIEDLALLRGFLQATPLTEEIKWGAPCYTHGGHNILMLSALKDCVTLSFFRGAELKDPEQLLEKPGPNSRFARYLRFSDPQTIAASKTAILRFIDEAIALAASGKSPEPSEETSLAYPEELEEMFATNPDFAAAFAALTPGRQRGYLLHFSSAKQAKTRIARIEKFMPKIFNGKGWQER